MSFNQLPLVEPLLRALKHEAYTTPTPIQVQAIPAILEGKDLLAIAQTGTGKTAAFSLPILQLLYPDKHQQPKRTKSPKALILTPTRELAIQVEESIRAYGRFLPVKSAVVFGGVAQGQQVQKLNAGTDIVIATPGRLLDLYRQRHISFQDIQFLVLDEADRMLDMGFIHDVRRIISALPTTRQTLFFSATMPGEISALSKSILKNPVRVQVTPTSSTVEQIEQEVYYAAKEHKVHLLKHLLTEGQIQKALVFTRTKHGADKVARLLMKAGISTQAIHGNKSQGARQTALTNFKSDKTRVLVATDIAARGIDIDELPHVINYDLPNTPETYVHRIGRTGRAGLEGKALSFCDLEEIILLKDIQKLIGKVIPVRTDHPYALSPTLYEVRQAPPMDNPSFRRRGGGGRKGGSLHRPAMAR